MNAGTITQHPPELAVILDDPRLQETERESLTRLLAVSVALEALAQQEDTTCMEGCGAQQAQPQARATRLPYADP